MLQGVNRHTHKCHKAVAPNFFGGSGVYCRNAIISAPPNFYRVTKAPRTAPSALHPKGAISASRQRHFSRAPASFIWCQLRIAAMPIEQRTKGRVINVVQKCHLERTLPNQFNGVIVKTQKCRDIVAPRGEANQPAQKCREEAASPQPVTGGHIFYAEVPKCTRPHRIWAIGMPQKCH